MANILYNPSKIIFCLLYGSFLLFPSLYKCETYQRLKRYGEKISFDKEGNIIFTKRQGTTLRPMKVEPLPPQLGKSREKPPNHISNSHIRKTYTNDELGASESVTEEPLNPNLEMQDHRYILGNTSTESQTQCHISATNPLLSQQIATLLEQKTKLINYDISVENITINPLMVNMSAMYRGNKWTRVSRHEGETILSLAFNYGVLSLMTLSLGVENMQVILRENPVGCLAKLSEEEKMGVVMELLIKDFKDTEASDFSEEESICHQVVQSSGGYALFTYRCCHAEADGVTISCYIVGKNLWLQIVDIILIAVKFTVLFFGPLLAPSGLFSASLDSTRYVIKINEPLLKTLCAVRGTSKAKVRAKHVIDLRDGRYFEKCRTQLSDLPVESIIPIKIEQFEIAVDYSKLLVENKVPVGLIRSLSNAVFNCGCKDVPPCSRCCHKDMFSHLKEMGTPVEWLSFWIGLGKLLMVAMIPAVFYVRLLFFYSFEYPEIDYRTHIAQQNQLDLSAHEFKMMQYLLPSHPLCITLYCLYGATVIILAYVGLTGDMKRFKRIIFTSFSDMNKLSWLKAFELVCAKFIWPFEKYGVVGCLIAPFYWTLVIPFILLVYFLYCLPLVFITARLIKYSLQVLRKAMHVSSGGRKSKFWGFGMGDKFDKGSRLVEEEFLLSEMLPKQDKAILDMDRPQTSSPRRDLIRGIAVILLVLSVFGISILATECVGFITEILTFTLMGIIVNASSVLKYMTLILLVLMYSYDCYDNVYKKYLKLNKSLFSDVKKRMKKKIEEVTSLPAHLQENTGFKACENDEQAEYESPDDISSDTPMHWELNDVIMFIDNEDMPRIPRKLFEQVCEIRVAGSPGPVYRSLIEASKKFMLIILFLMFVFLVVLSFGSIYKVSSTNQTLATLAGGFVPFIMRNFMQPSTPDIELGTVSFSSKLDEIIQNFSQHWPMYDLPFTLNDGDKDGKEDEKTQDKSTQTTNMSSVYTQTQQEVELSKSVEMEEINHTYHQINSYLNQNEIFGNITHNAELLTIPTFHQDEQALWERFVRTNNPSDMIASNGPKSMLQMNNQGQILRGLHDDNRNKNPLGRNGFVQNLFALPEVEEITTSLLPKFESTCGQEVDLLVLLPEVGDANWCRVWSNISLFNDEKNEDEQGGIDDTEENQDPDDSQTTLKVIA